MKDGDEDTPAFETKRPKKIDWQMLVASEMPGKFKIPNVGHQASDRRS
jgi:hypothetical protein